MGNKKQLKSNKGLKKKKKVVKHKKRKLDKVKILTRDSRGRKTKYYRPYVKHKYVLKKPRVIPNYFYFRGYLSSWLNESGTDWRRFGTFNQVSSILWKSLLPEQKRDLGFLKNNIDQIWSEVFKADLKAWQKELQEYMDKNYSSVNWWMLKDMVIEVGAKEAYRFSQCSFSFTDTNEVVIDEITNADVFNAKMFLQMRRDINNPKTRYKSSDVYYNFDEITEVDGKLVIQGTIHLYNFPTQEIDLKKYIKEKAKEEKEKGEAEKAITPPSEAVKLKELELAIEKEKTRQLELENEKLNKISEMIKAGFSKAEIMKILDK